MAKLPFALQRYSSRGPLPGNPFNILRLISSNGYESPAALEVAKPGAPTAIAIPGRAGITMFNVPMPDEDRQNYPHKGRLPHQMSAVLSWKGPADTSGRAHEASRVGDKVTPGQTFKGQNTARYADIPGQEFDTMEADPADTDALAAVESKAVRVQRHRGRAHIAPSGLVVQLRRFAGGGPLRHCRDMQPRKRSRGRVYSAPGHSIPARLAAGRLIAGKMAQRGTR